jgi:UDP:flavonoid glycosyltransferase YjiC (YdhE family)
MPRILFVAEHVTLAHVARPLALASMLDRARYEVLFAGGETYRSFIDRAGFPHLSLPSIDAETFLTRLRGGHPVYRRSEIESYVNAELTLLRDVRPDLVIGDFRVSLGISAGLSGVPYVNVVNAYWSPYSLQRFPAPDLWLTRTVGPALATLLLRTAEPLAFRYHARPFNVVARAHRLDPLGSLRQVYTHGTWTLYPDLPRLAPTGDRPPNHLYIGPVLWEPNLAPPPPEPADDRPLVYVTLGSSGSTRLLEIVIEALGGLPVAALIATAARWNAGTLPQGFVAMPFVPGMRAARSSALVVGNGGSLTNYQALAAGVPVLGLPWNADQHLAMETVAREGAGILVRSDRATVALIHRAAERLLADQRYRTRAAALGREIAAFDPAPRFLAFIDAVT